MSRSSRLLQRARRLLGERLSERSALHCERVGAQAVVLARRFRVNKADAELAGLLHDLARDETDEHLLELAELLGVRIREFDLEHPRMLHAPVSAALARRDLPGINADVIDAIASHTAGRVGMTDLDMVVYLADMIEPERDFAGVDELRRICRRESLAECFRAAYAHSVAHLEQKGRPLDPVTDDVIAEIEEESGRPFDPETVPGAAEEAFPESAAATASADSEIPLAVAAAPEPVQAAVPEPAVVTAVGAPFGDDGESTDEFDEDAPGSDSPDASDEADRDTEASDAPESDERFVKPVRRRRSKRAHRIRRKSAGSAVVSGAIAATSAEAEPLAAVAGDPIPAELGGVAASASADEDVTTSEDVPDEPRPKRSRRDLRPAAARAGRSTLLIAIVVIVALGALAGIVLGVNWLARWNALREAARVASVNDVANNLLVIGVDDGVATGFTAMKLERENRRVLGIAIPDGAFVQIPGQGFERIGSSYVSGPDVSKDTVSNYLGVSFTRYLAVDGATYRDMLKSQDLTKLTSNVIATDLKSNEKDALAAFFKTVSPKNVWIVPLPVKPIVVGDQQYFEPQRDQVADLLLQWWGVEASQQRATPRVIVYNGVGTPGLAGLASQQLIRTGFRIVNSGNAENFDYKKTQIYLYHGTQADAEAVREALGVGEIVVQSAPQDVTDMIVIIGADYRPPAEGGSTVPTEGDT